MSVLTFYFDDSHHHIPTPPPSPPSAYKPHSVTGLQALRASFFARGEKSREGWSEWECSDIIKDKAKSVNISYSFLKLISWLLGKSDGFMIRLLNLLIVKRRKFDL